MCESCECIRVRAMLRRCEDALHEAREYATLLLLISLASNAAWVVIAIVRWRAAR